MDAGKIILMDAGEIIQIAFEEVHPGPGNDYMYHLSIQKFLDETSFLYTFPKAASSKQVCSLSTTKLK